MLIRVSCGFMYRYMLGIHVPSIGSSQLIKMRFQKNFGFGHSLAYLYCGRCFFPSLLIRIDLSILSLNIYFIDLMWAVRNGSLCTKNRLSLAEPNSYSHSIHLLPFLSPFSLYWHRRHIEARIHIVMEYPFSVTIGSVSERLLSYEAVKRDNEMKEKTIAYSHNVKLK